MYCPGCGSNNKSETKFCTLCGTDLAAVSEALAGNKRDRAEIDERMVLLFKNYYQGRRSIVIGVVAIALGLMKLMFGAFLGIADKYQFLYPFLMAVAIYGLLALFSGLSKWTAASSEIKAIEKAAAQPPLAAADRPAIQSAEQPAPLSKSYDTGAIPIPVSVTEQTTRQLADHKRPATSQPNAN